MIASNLDTIKVILGLLAPAVVWFVTKRHFQKKELSLKDKVLHRKDVENEAASLDVIEKKLSFYEKMLDDLDLRYLKQIEGLKKEIEILERDGKVKDEIICDLKSRIKKLTNDV